MGTGALALGALGVVFGDIGTSPLYAVREAFEHQHLPVVETNALGVASIASGDDRSLSSGYGIMLPGLVLNYFGQRGSWGCWRRDRTLLVVVRTADIPDVPDEDRAEVCRLEPAVHQVILTFGFMEEPDVPQALSRVEINRVLLDPAEISYFTGRELAIQGDAEGMYPLLEHLFVRSRADSASRFFKLPPERVFEVGTHVEI